jgi:hypothetical protein
MLFLLFQRAYAVTCLMYFQRRDRLPVTFDVYLSTSLFWLVAF